METRERDGEPVPVADVAASFQEAVCDVLTAQGDATPAGHGATDLLIGGGVAANSPAARAAGRAACGRAGITLRPRGPACAPTTER